MDSHGQIIVLARQKISEFYRDARELFSNFVVKIYSIIILATNLLMWALCHYFLTRIKDAEIALHYNVDFGIDYYGRASNLYIIPAVSMIIALINLFVLVAVKRNRDKKFILHILMTGALIANIILFTALVSIYLINTR